MTQTNTTQNKEELSKEVEKRFNDKFTYGGITGTACLNPKKFEHGLEDPRPFKKFLAKELSQAHQSGIEEGKKAERKSWYSPFDGLEIKLMYRDGDKVLQNKYIF